MVSLSARLALLFAGVAGALMPAPAVEAHGSWTTGAPVPEWVRNACCGPSDTHHLAPSQVHPAPGGFQVDGVQGVVPWAKVLPSEDGDYWIFYRDFSDGTQYVFCFFAPPEGASFDGGQPIGRASGGGGLAAPAGLAA